MDAEQRLSRLERSLRRWKVGTAAAVIALVAMGAAQRVPDEITAKSLTIVDDQGVKRILLATDGNDVAAIHLYNGREERRLSLYTRASNDDAFFTARLARSQKQAILLGLYKDQPHLKVGPEGESSVLLLANPKLGGVMMTTDKDGTATSVVPTAAAAELLQEP